MKQLEQLASLLGSRDAIDTGIADLIFRPALKGNVGEWIAQDLQFLDQKEIARREALDVLRNGVPVDDRAADRRRPVGRIAVAAGAKQ